VLPGLICGVGVLFVVAACGAVGRESPDSTPLPCVPSQDPVELGAPFPDAAPTIFRTTGGSLVFRATRFQHGGVLDPKVGRTQISLGRTSHPPRYDPARQDVANEERRFEAVEGDFTVVDLPGGEYWMVNSRGVWITVAGCTPTRVSVIRLGEDIAGGGHASAINRTNP
jgi:hypothetical protein